MEIFNILISLPSSNLRVSGLCHLSPCSVESILQYYEWFIPTKLSCFSLFEFGASIQHSFPIWVKLILQFTFEIYSSLVYLGFYTVYPKIHQNLNLCCFYHTWTVPSLFRPISSFPNFLFVAITIILNYHCLRQSLEI